ncbi:hypothetical protein BRD18_01995 [Halobacteriales archaeon SW_7_71_33]|nr:MAG: hypothetical protein BRD18_01995 [Halobacteriales archaeon SW_7_71_33]
MTGYLEIVVIALGAQLAVLPGEKVQFIIAGLSTRYHPLMVVSAAGTAFALWTAVEVAFGEAIQRVLPPLVLELLTAALFLVFAAMLYRSAPESEADRPDATDADGVAETDGGLATAGDALEVTPTVFGREVPSYLGGWLPIFAMMFAGEFGDKTQLVTIGLAAQYGATSAIWVGEMLAIVPVSLANAYLFHRFSGRFDLRTAHLVSALLFAFFGIDTLQAVVTGVSVWETTVEAFADVVLSLL